MFVAIVSSRGVAAPSAVLSYLIIFAAGIMGGRLIYTRKKSMVLRW